MRKSITLKWISKDIFLETQECGLDPLGLGASSMTDTCINDIKHSGSMEDREFFD